MKNKLYLYIHILRIRVHQSPFHLYIAGKVRGVPETVRYLKNVIVQFEIGSKRHQLINFFLFPAS